MRHFPARLSAVPPTVLEDLGGAVSGGRVNSLSAAWTLLALDAYAKAVGASGKLSIAEIGKDGRERALTLPPGAMPKARCGASEKTAVSLATTTSANRAYSLWTEMGPLTALTYAFQNG